MKRLLIITGPQGSGNHVFSRLLSLHPEVSGWDDLLNEYWIPSDQEPFADYWVNPELLSQEHFADSDYHLANVSCPFFYDGIRHIPKIVEVAKRAESFGVKTSVAIIVRDQTINQLQQERVRREHTTPLAQDYYYNTLIPSGIHVDFIDSEAFFLHTKYYLRWLSKVIDFPIDIDNPDLLKYITVSPNRKYVQAVDSHWLDDAIKHGSSTKRTER